MPKLSERVPWYEQTRQAAWSRELAQEVEAQGERLDILEGKYQQAPVDRRLVEEALATALEWEKGFVEDSWALSNLLLVIDPLRRALEGDPDDQD